MCDALRTCGEHETSLVAAVIAGWVRTACLQLPQPWQQWSPLVGVKLTSRHVPKCFVPPGSGTPAPPHRWEGRSLLPRGLASVPPPFPDTTSCLEERRFGKLLLLPGTDLRAKRVWEGTRVKYCYFLLPRFLLSLDDALYRSVTAKLFCIDVAELKGHLCLTFMDNGAGMTHRKLYGMLK